MDSDKLEALARIFFEEVIKTLKERHQGRGDTFLELDLDDFGTFFKTKGGRIKALSEKISQTALELLDEIVDEAGYAALACIKLASLMEGSLEDSVKTLCSARRGEKDASS